VRYVQRVVAEASTARASCTVFFLITQICDHNVTT
jgi:hypothetical protein